MVPYSYCGVGHFSLFPPLLNQINFLNSVIVDLQRKNGELKVKLEKMVLTEFNGNDEDEG